MIRNALFISVNDIRFMLREKSTLLWLFVMPVVFFYFIGTVTSGFGDTGAGTGPVALFLEAPESDAGSLQVLLERLEEHGFRLVRSPSPQEGARRLQIPADFEGLLETRQPIDLRFQPGSEGLTADYDQFRLQRAVYSVLADLIVLENEGREFSEDNLREVRARVRSVGLEIETARRDRKIPSGFDQAVPGILVMFTLLVVLTSGATLLILEREKGLLLRLAACPIPRRDIVFGKWCGRMVLAGIQILFAMITGSILFSVDWGSSLPMIGLLLLAWGAFCASFGLLLGNLARTQSQAAGIGVLTANVLGALGGCWWPIEITPPWMQSLQMLMPSGWTMRALHQLVNFGAAWTSAVTPLILLILGTLILGALATRTFRFQ